MYKKMIFGVLLTIVGLVFAVFSYIYAASNPWDWNGIQGILGSMLGTHMLIPFITAMTVMIVGLVICYKDAYSEQ